PLAMYVSRNISVSATLANSRKPACAGIRVPWGFVSKNPKIVETRRFLREFLTLSRGFLVSGTSEQLPRNDCPGHRWRARRAGGIPRWHVFCNRNESPRSQPQLFPSVAWPTWVSSTGALLPEPTALDLPSVRAGAPAGGQLLGRQTVSILAI